jgi:hypothetical protein
MELAHSAFLLRYQHDKALANASALADHFTLHSPATNLPLPDCVVLECVVSTPSHKIKSEKFLPALRLVSVPRPQAGLRTSVQCLVNSYDTTITAHSVQETKQIISLPDVLFIELVYNGDKQNVTLNQKCTLLFQYEYVLHGKVALLDNALLLCYRIEVSKFAHEFANFV